MKFPNLAKANKYCRNVVGGTIPVSRWVRLACQKHLDELRKQSTDKTYPWIFDRSLAERACMFAQLFPHVKGRWASQTNNALVLEPWQLFFLSSIFGWVSRSTGLRRYQRALLFVPRKNGKSHLAAVIGLYMLAADDEEGAEVYSGATTEKQAWEIFRPAKLMASRTPDYLEAYGVTVNASNISIADRACRFEALIGNPGDGASPSCALIDEYHEHKSDMMFDTMRTGMGAREQPLMLITTTAGDNIAGPCYELQLGAQHMLDGTIVDERLFALIYCADPGDDWADESTLCKANPNYNVSISGDFLSGQLAIAKSNPRKQSIYKTKHLNTWVGAMDAYFNLERWKESTDESLRLEDFEGRPCYLGLDLASRVDIAALELLFPVGDNDYVRFGKYYLPEAKVMGSDHDENEKHGEEYQGWAADGWITLTDGDMTDFAVIRDDILDICKRHDVKELAFDPFQAAMLITELMKHNIPVVETRMTVLSMSEPMKYLDGLILSRRVRHNGDPVMAWMVSNVVARRDAKDNVYPRKERNESKIDGVIALLMALGRCMLADDASLDDALSNFIVATL